MLVSLVVKNGANHILLPREHGAWGMVSLPFIAAAAVGGDCLSLRMLAAAVTVISVFLFRTPLLVLWRNDTHSGAFTDKHRSAGPRAQDERRVQLQSAGFSLKIYASAAAVAGAYLLWTLPVSPLLLLGAGAALLMWLAVYLTVRNYQRYALLQIASAAGLTASSLVAYLAARGRLEGPAFWIWGLSAAHSAASVLVVHARLESIVASRKSLPPTSFLPHTRNALLAQAGLWLLLGTLAVKGKPWLILPFLPPSFLHCWQLGQLVSGKGLKIPLRRVGWMQLSASVAFCFLLVAVLR